MKKKPFLLWLLMIVVLPALAQTEIQLIVKGENIKEVSIFDLSQIDIQQFEYADTVNAVFAKKHIDCYNIIYHSDRKRFQKQIWLDPGKVKIYGHIDSSSFVIDTVINSTAYYEVIAFYRMYSSLNIAKDTAALNDHLLAGVRRFSTSPFYLAAADLYVGTNQNSPAQLLPLKDIIDSVPDKFSWFLLYGVAERMEKILAGVKVVPGNYSFTGVKGDKAKISLQGSAHYVLDFWFLDCKPCREDHLQIKDDYKLFRNNNVEMISVSTDSDYKKWIAYLKQHGYNWPNYLQDADVNITKDLSISAFPTYVILDSNWKVVAMYNSYESVKKILLVKN
jgi:peroxiredoxin